MRISIIGWYGMRNVGDEAFRVVFEELFAGHEVEFVLPPRKCNNPDIAILGGGAVVSPFYLESIPDCPHHAVGVDIAYESEVELLSKHNFKSVYVRNSRDVARIIEKVSCPVTAIPDLAFLLRPSGRDILGKYKKTSKRTLGVFATDYVNPAIDRPIATFSQRANEFKTIMAQELDGLSKDFEIVLVPCATDGYGDDRRINLDIAAFMKNRPTNILDTLSPQDMIDLIAQLDLTWCTRFHAHIFSMIAGTPFISIDFTRKVRLFLEENNLQFAKVAWFVGDDFILSELDEKIKAVDRDDLRYQLKSTALVYHDQLVEVMKSTQQSLLRLPA